MKTIMPVMLLLMSALLLVACLAGPANLDLQSGDSDQGDWQTYTSARYNFTVQFPSGWQAVELPTADYPTVTDQVWFVSETLPPPQTGARADIALVFSQEDPSPSWKSEYFNEYQSDAFRLGELEGRRISGINKESLGSELVVLVQVGDRYLQASPNQGEASLKYFDRVISSLRFAPTQAPTPPPPATAVPESLDEQTVVFEGTSFTCPAWLAEGAAAQRIPAFVDPSGFMYDDLPEHVRFGLLNSYAARAPLAGLPTIWAPWLKHQTLDSPEMQPQIFILPAAEYAAISPLAAERIETLRTLLDGGAFSAGDQLPVLPTFNSAQDVRGQVQPVAFDGGRGLRFIARYSQETMPVINPAVFYTFQGLTDDGRYYVAAFFPLYVALLPDQIAVDDWEAFNITYAAYLSETTAALEGLAPAEFAPDLTSLDAVIASLRVDPQGLSFLVQPLAATPDSPGGVPRDVAPDIAPATLVEVVAGNNRFAFDLFRAVRGREGNLVFSPLSISTALAMTYAGARGETAAQMADALHVTLPPMELYPALDALTRGLTAMDDGGAFELTFANALWGQQGVAFRPEFLALLAPHGAGLRLVDFRSEAGRQAAGDLINRWVRDATAGKISDLVDPRLLTDMTRLVLTNAIAFDGRWEVPFDDAAPAGFTTADGTPILVSLMRRRAITSYASGETWQAAALRYEGGRARMLVLLPAEGQFEAFARDLDVARLAEIEAALTPTDLALYLPRFAFAADVTLAETLMGMGMTLPFSTTEADFSGMAEIWPPLRISDVLHKARVAVDELGTAAAAATAVELEVGTEDTKPALMRADRPFLFLIRDTQQGTILFLGRLANPAA